MCEQRGGREQGTADSRRRRRHHGGRHPRDKSPCDARLQRGAVCWERGPLPVLREWYYPPVEQLWNVSASLSHAGVLRWSDVVRGGCRDAGARQTRSGSCEDQLRGPARSHFHHWGQSSSRQDAVTHSESKVHVAVFCPDRKPSRGRLSSGLSGCWREETWLKPLKVSIRCTKV